MSLRISLEMSSCLISSKLQVSLEKIVSLGVMWNANEQCLCSCEQIEDTVKFSVWQKSNICTAIQEKIMKSSAKVHPIETAECTPIERWKAT